MTLTSYFHRLQSQWQVAKLQNTPENPVEAKQVVKAFFISPGTRGNKWRLLLASSPNSPLLSCWNGTGKKKKKKCLYITHLYLTALNFSFTSWKLFVLYPFLPFLSTQKQCSADNTYILTCPDWLIAIDGLYQSPWLSLLKPLAHLSVLFLKYVGFTWCVRRCYVSKNQWTVWIQVCDANNSITEKVTKI